MKLTKLSLAILSAAFLLISTAPAKSATLLSDNFDTENSGAGKLNYTGYTNWDSGNTNLVGNGFNDVLPGNGLYANLKDIGSSFLQSKRLFTFNAGDTVNLSFRLAGSGNSNSGLLVTLGSIFISVYTAPGTPFQTISETILVTPDLATFAQANPLIQYLIFQGGGNSSTNLYIDNVSVTDQLVSPTAVPEPSMVPGLLLVTAFGIKKLVVQRQKSIQSVE
ncbi:hypothetical protein [Chamaesiphon sp.]|uniref:hypothetical protein n=1 Tax=Chamaesiphon sp. TaxID=2814140 RepID=UPI0035940536